MAELIQFEWFQSLQTTLSQDKQLDISANLAAFRKTTTFQSGVCSIIANLQTKAEDLAEMREMFLKLDADSNGFLTLEELEAGMQDISSIFHLEEPDVRDMLRAADVNGDGQVDYTEFISAAFQKDMLLSGNNLQAAFRMFDADGDGTVSKDELKQVFGGGHVSQRGEQVWDEIMNEVDKNNDGVISYDEFENAMKVVLMQRATFV